MSNPERLIATSSQTVGPFFHFGLTANDALGIVARPDDAGERIQLRVGVFDGEGTPVPDAVVEIYQADAHGAYPSPTASAAEGFTGFGRLPTGADGWCTFTTIKPGAVPTERPQAAHVNVCLLSRGLLRQLYTRMYFHGDATLASDPILALVPAERRQTLIAAPVADEPHTWRFVIRMQGENETVFFDL